MSTCSCLLWVLAISLVVAGVSEAPTQAYTVISLQTIVNQILGQSSRLHFVLKVHFLRTFRGERSVLGVWETVAEE